MIPQRNLSLAVAALACGAGPAQACTPIIPLTAMMFGGPTSMAASYGGAILGGVVVLKCVLYASQVRSSPRAASMFWMFLANLYSTFIGLLMLLPLQVPIAMPLWLIPIAICAGAGRTLGRVTRLASKRTLPASAIAVLLFVAFFGSFVAYFVSQGYLSQRSTSPLAYYWAWKWFAVTLTLACSLTLTCALEMVVVVGKLEDAKLVHERARAVLLANLWAFLLVSLVGAIIALPHRLRSPNGLIGESVLHPR
jgi:hypothetical protein